MKRKILIISILLVVVTSISIYLYRYGINPNVIRIVNAEKIFEIKEVYPITRMEPDIYFYEDKKGVKRIYEPTDYYIVLTKNGSLCKYTTGSYIKGIKYSEYTIEKTKKLSKDEIKELTMEIDNLDDIKFDYYSSGGSFGSGGKGYCITQNDKTKHVDKNKLNNILKKYGFEF